MRLFVFFLSAAAWAGPCITANTSCTEWVNVGNTGGRSLIYRTYSLDAKNRNVARALIMIHGAGRDADNYFRTAVASAFLAGALDDTIVIAPRFASSDGRSCRDALARDEISWSCTGDSWRSGGVSLSHPNVTSYDLADEILRKLARKAIFPNLRRIVVTGHSAGGQFVNRYEMANKVHDSLGIPIHYVVSNPSSYAYLDSTRPAADGKEFRPPAESNCPNYDRWPYGFQNRTGYAGPIADDVLKKQLAARPVVYLLGELDVFPLAGFDSSCPAMAQGPTRLARGQAFANYVNQKWGARHAVTVIPLCGHNARCMYTAEPALPILFPKPGSL